MSDDCAGRLPGEFATMIERKVGLKAWQFMVMDASIFHPDRMRWSVVFFHAVWSAKSVQLLRELRQRIDGMGQDGLPCLIILDADAVKPEMAKEWFEGPAPDWGEHIWLQNGHVLRRFNRHSKTADLDEFLQGLGPLMAQKHEEANHATPTPPEDHALHESPDSVLRLPASGGSSFMA